MNFREAMYEFKKLKERELEILQAKVELQKTAIFLINEAFQADISKMSAEEILEIHDCLRDVMRHIQDLKPTNLT